ncbi:MAG: DUF3237 domain-containing protein [Vicinamibacterales bacterium]
MTMDRNDLSAGDSVLAQRDAESATAVPPLNSTWLMDMFVRVESGGPVIGPRRIAPISGGTFRGPRLRGKVVGPAGEWGVVNSVGAYAIDVRFQLETDDSELIHIAYSGYIYPSRQRETAPVPDNRYWRIRPVFDTASSKYEWLNRIVCVGVKYDVPPELGSFGYHIYEIL